MPTRTQLPNTGEHAVDLTVLHPPMRCHNCEFNNDAGATACLQCGASLTNTCDSCGHVNLIASRFCSACGARLSAVVRETRISPPSGRVEDDPSRGASDQWEGDTAERRQLTVMFTDLVGSTEMSERLDPEDLRKILHDYQSYCSKVVSRYGGYLAKYLGDGLLVYFGYPIAHEDDAVRAVRAGLGILQAMARLGSLTEKEFGVTLQIRVGVHTGLVVAGDMDSSKHLEQMAVVGDTPNIAARVQSVADPDSLVITASTNSLVQGYFRSQDLGRHELRGITEPLQLFRITSESAARSRLDAASPGGLTPLVGRDDERVELSGLWSATLAEGGRVAILRGEAGIGKSRLVQSLKDSVADTDATAYIECRCSALYQSSPLFPFVDMLTRTFLGFQRADTADEKLEAIEGFAAASGLKGDEAVPLIALLLHVPVEGRYSMPALTPERLRVRTMDVLATALANRTESMPTVLAFEDLHWADPSSLDLLTSIMDRLKGTRLLMLMTCRPEFVSPWEARADVATIELRRLPASIGEQLALSVAGGKRLPKNVMRQIVEKTDGVPLFVEELTRTLLQSGQLDEKDDRYEVSGSLPSLDIPATLQGSLMARLDQLAPLKRTAQLAATIGREFSVELLHLVSRLDSPVIEHELVELEHAGVVLRRDDAPTPTYMFRHALVQDAAYESLLKTRRQSYHRRIAEVLETEFPETVESQPEVLAHHFTEARIADRAIECWQQAGKKAVQRWANAEAILHLRNGLRVLSGLPESEDRASQELTIQMALGAAFVMSKGFAVPEVEAAYTRAYELCDAISNAPMLTGALQGLFLFYVLRGPISKAIEISNRTLAESQKLGDTGMIAMSNSAAGTALLLSGRVADSMEHFDRAIEVYDPVEHRGLVETYAHEPGISSMAMRGLALQALGYSDSALLQHDDVDTVARTSGIPYTIAFMLVQRAALWQMRSDPQQTRRFAEEAIAVATEHEFPMWGLAASLPLGWALSQLGDVDAGLQLFNQCLGGLKAIGTRGNLSYQYVWLADILRTAGRCAEAVDLCDTAIAHVEQIGDAWMLPEIHRLRAECLFISTPSAVERVESDLMQAITIARAQDSRWFELRAACSLADIWRKQREGDRARALLLPVYEWFTEGFATNDLLRARSLLNINGAEDDPRPDSGARGEAPSR